MDEPLFEHETLTVEDVTGMKLVRISVAGHEHYLAERQARDLHLAIRAWVRRQKRLRGETPRGAAELIHG